MKNVIVIKYGGSLMDDRNAEKAVLENIQRRIAKELKNAVVIKKAVIGKRLKELGYVGKFTNAEISKINEVLNKKKIAVISPVGKSKDGQILNFNADDIAEGRE